MADNARSALEFVGVQFAAIVAGVHLYWAIPRLIRQLQIDQPIWWDPRPLVFIVSGIVLLAGLVLLQRGVLRRVYGYVLGIGLMLTYLLGWAYWHLNGHLAALPWIERPHGHGGDPLVILAQHFVGSPVDAIAKTAEFLLLIVLVALLYIEFVAVETASSESSDSESEAGSRPGQSASARPESVDESDDQLT